MPLTDGQAFAGYTVLGIIGTGGMGEVYRVQHPRLPRTDALKVLGPAVSADAEFRQRFNLEAEMAATLNHPNIVRIYDRGDFEGQLWIAMEYVDGTDAARLLADRHPNGMPPADLVDLVAGVAAALDYAHDQGLLHRDIKPANILIGRHGGDENRILLADFGVARWIGRSNDLTGVDMTVGTVTYAAPEQLRGDDVGGRADQYALAATAFHLLTGHPPFTATNPAIVIGQHLDAPPPAVDAARPELSRFGPVFARALAKNPEDRFRRCADFAAALRTALAGGHGSPARHRLRAPSPGRWTRPPSRRWSATVAGLAVLAVAGSAAGALLAGHRKSGSTPATPPPPAVSGRMDLPVVVMAADCAVLGSAAVAEDGSPAYCAPDPTRPGASVWSVQPQKLRSANPAP